MYITDQKIKSILENEKMTVSLLGFQFKVGWMKPCTYNCIYRCTELRHNRLISSQEYFARICAALILNDLFLLMSLYHILWRLLFLFSPRECLVVFSKTCLDREFELKYECKNISLFIEKTKWLHKRRFFIDKYYAKNVFSVAKLYLFSRDDLSTQIINYYVQKRSNN